MAFLDDSVLDAALDEIKTATRLLLCSSQPADYAAAVAATLATKDTPVFGANGDYAGGRQFQVSAITDATGDADGTATHYALVNVTGTLLLASQSLSSSVGITTGSTVEIDAFNVQNPDVA
jgi:hypothetical protein